jgi:hypothetical protein
MIEDGAHYMHLINEDGDNNHCMNLVNEGSEQEGDEGDRQKDLVAPDVVL